MEPSFRQRYVQCASPTGLHRMAYVEWGSRGNSEWLKDPNEYQVPVYANDMVALIARLDVDTVHWIGTSMGGLIGMSLAALPGSPVTKLVLNDVGPLVTAASVSRIDSYVGK